MRRTIVVAALVLVAATDSTAGMTDLERQRLIAHLDMTAAWLTDEVSDLSATQLEFKPDASAWSIAQVLDHLLVVAPIYWRDLQTALKQPPGRGRMTDADVLWYGIDRTQREKAIPTELPKGSVRNVNEALEVYRKHHERLRQYVATTDDDLRAHVVQRQRCDAYQWALLISTHEQRHLLQIREIKTDRRFPKR